MSGYQKLLRNVARSAAAVSLAAGAAASCTSSEPATAPGWRTLNAADHDLRHHLVHETLRGPSRVEKYDVHLNEADKELKAEIRLGHKVCGHPETVHGGAIAAVIDDCAGMLFLHCGCGTGYTANLNINYRRPLPAGTDVIMECKVMSIEPSKSNPSSQKVTIGCRVRDAADTTKVFTEAQALFVVKNVPGGALWHVTKTAPAANPAPQPQ